MSNSILHQCLEQYSILNNIKPVHSKFPYGALTPDNIALLKKTISLTTLDYGTSKSKADGNLKTETKAKADGNLKTEGNPKTETKSKVSSKTKSQETTGGHSAMLVFYG